MVMMVDGAAKNYPALKDYLRKELVHVANKTKVFNAWIKWSVLGAGAAYRLGYGVLPEVNVDSGGMIGCTYRDQDKKTELIGFKYGVTVSKKQIVLAKELAEAFEVAKGRSSDPKAPADDKLIFELVEATVLHEMIHWSYAVAEVDEKKKFGDEEHATQNFEREAYGRLVSIPLEKWKCFVAKSPPFVGIKKDAGGKILAVKPGSPAAKAGLMVDDVLREVDGKVLRDDYGASQFDEYVATKSPGDVITVKVRREFGASMQILSKKITLDPTP